jgi:hypothetical protein
MLFNRSSLADAVNALSGNPADMLEGAAGQFVSAAIGSRICDKQAFEVGEVKRRPN